MKSYNLYTVIIYRHNYEACSLLKVSLYQLFMKLAKPKVVQIQQESSIVLRNLVIWNASISAEYCRDFKYKKL